MPIGRDVDQRSVLIHTAVSTFFTLLYCTIPCGDNHTHLVSFLPATAWGCVKNLRLGAHAMSSFQGGCLVSRVGTINQPEFQLSPVPSASSVSTTCCHLASI